MKMTLLGCVALLGLPDVAAAQIDIRCAVDACIVAYAAGADSDGDGVTDADEVAAGTDPFNAKAAPRMSKLLDMIRLDKLPSFREHHAILVVLPTQALNGKPLLGGALALPGRQNTLATLGITSSMIGSLDLRNGLAIGRGSAPGSSGKPPIRVGGIDMALISAGGGSTSPAPAAAITRELRAAGCGYCLDPSRVTASNSTTVGSTSIGSMRMEMEDDWVGPTGETTDVTWSSGPDGHSVTVTVREGGNIVRVTSETEKSTKNADGTTTKTTTTVIDDRKTGDKTTKQKVKNGDGSTQETVEKKNGKTNVTTKTKTTTAADGSTKRVTQTCTDDGCTDDTIDNTCDAACEDAAAGKAKTYVNPDDTTYDASTDLRRMGLAPTDMISTIVAVHGGNVTQGETPVEIEEEPVASTPDGPLVIHVEEDPSGNLGLGLGTGLPKHVPLPRFDPLLPLVPTSGPPPDSCGMPGAC